MNELIDNFRNHLSSFLNMELSRLTEDFWSSRVLYNLNPQQNKLVHEKGISQVDDLDLAALLRVLQRNWREIDLPRDHYTYASEAQNIRNKYAHKGGQDFSVQDTFRDLDTLERLSIALSFPAIFISEIAQEKASHTEQQPIESPALDNTTSSALFQPEDKVVTQDDRKQPLIFMSQTGNKAKVVKDGQVTEFFIDQLFPYQDEKNDEESTSQQLKALLTSTLITNPSLHSIYSLHSGKIDYVPYQYRPIIKLINSDQPRLLIADETGVGKTIEGGLILKELKVRMGVEKALIICPKALVIDKKWEREMERFGERFRVLDGNTLNQCLRETEKREQWPDDYSYSILPHSLCSKNLLEGKSRGSHVEFPGLSNMEHPPAFDLLIVDEAHHMRNTGTLLHQVVKELAQHAKAVIFLTATPIQTSTDNLYNILHLLRPDLIIDKNSFNEMLAPNEFINGALDFMRSTSSDWQQKALSELDKVSLTSWGQNFIVGDPAFQEILDTLHSPSLGNENRLKLYHNLERFYTFDRLINRTRRRDIDKFTTRRAHAISADYTPEQRDFYEDVVSTIVSLYVSRLGDSPIGFLLSTFRRLSSSCIFAVAPMIKRVIGRDKGWASSITDTALEHKEKTYDEKELEDANKDTLSSFTPKLRLLLERSENLQGPDRKTDQLLEILTEKAQQDRNKVLLFTAYLDTLNYLDQKCKEVGLKAKKVNGKMAPEDQRYVRYCFSLPKDHPEAIDILLSSEIGCEGLDYQFCDCMVNYDLPWNPMKIEQRIGRIDRRGQESEYVDVYNLMTAGTIDEDIYNRCLSRIGVFQDAIGGNEIILGALVKSLSKLENQLDLTTEEKAQKLQIEADNYLRDQIESERMEENAANFFGLQVPKKEAEINEEVASLDNKLLSPTLIENLVSHFLTSVTGKESPFRGKSQEKTLELKQESRDQVLQVLKDAKLNKDDARVKLTRWLRGKEQFLPVSFDPEVVKKELNRETVLIDTVHPLVKLAIEHVNKVPCPLESNLISDSTTLPAGTYPFLLYLWEQKGDRPNNDFHLVTSSDLDQESLLAALISAESIQGDRLPKETIEELETKHYQQWSSARGNYLEKNDALLAQSLHSLETSFKAVKHVIQQQITDARDTGIRDMRVGELRKKEQEYQESRDNLINKKGDLHPKLLAQGTLTLK